MPAAVAAEEQTLDVSSFDGTSLHVRIEGRRDAPVVIFSHALGGSLAFWDQQAAAFRDRYRVIRYDTRGHGRSQSPDGPYSIDMLGRDALAVMNACEVSSASFVGLSQGGMTGMWLAANEPQRIERLVLANTTAFIPVKDHWNTLIETALAQGMEPIAEKTVTGWLSPQFKSAQPQRTAALVDMMRSMAPSGYAGCCAVLRDVDLRADLARIVAPTLVIAGIEDGERGAAAAAALVSGIKGARRVDIAEAAHLSAVENPEAFNRAVAEFLA